MPNYSVALGAEKLGISDDAQPQWGETLDDSTNTSTLHYIFSSRRTLDLFCVTRFRNKSGMFNTLFLLLAWLLTIVNSVSGTRYVASLIEFRQSVQELNGYFSTQRREIYHATIS